MNSVSDIAASVFGPLLQWDRLRHPYAGWVRIALGLLFLLVVWSHDWLMIILLALAICGHGYWFPSHVGAGEDEPLMTRLVDAWQHWLEETPSLAKTLAILPGAAFFLPLAVAFWQHQIF